MNMRKMRKIRKMQIGFRFLFFSIFSMFLAVANINAFAVSTNASDSINRILGNTQDGFGLSPKHVIPRRSSLESAKQKEYDFIFFYSTSCPHCMQFEPVLKAYSDNTGIAVKAFAIGDRVSPVFPNSILVAQEVVEQFFGKGASVAVPTLFILNKFNLHAYPVSSGTLTYSELSTRMGKLMPKILRNEKNERNGKNEGNKGNV